MSTDYRLITIDSHNNTATITMQTQGSPVVGSGSGGHRIGRAGELALALEELRVDNSIRVIVITGTDDVFTYPPSAAPWHGNPGVDWDGMQATTRILQALVEIEKPVIAKVNGPAVGFGSSLVFGADFIVAREDAVIVDHHLAMGEVMINGERRGLGDRGVVPGDGGAVFVPLAMPPTMAKEYLMLAKSWTAAELHHLGIVNYAVPAEQLDAVTQDLVDRLLRRNAYALAWSKRVVNARHRMSLSMVGDAALSYEFLGFYMQNDDARQRGGERGISEL